MADQRVPFSHSLVGRMILVGVIPTLLLLGLIITLNTRWNFRAGIASLEAHIRAEAALAAAEINGSNERAVLAAQRMAEAQVAGMFGRRGESLAFARAVLEASPEFTGAYFGYEPNADGGDAAHLTADTVPEGAMDEEGRFIPYWFVDPDNADAITLEPLVDMETSLYYQGVRDTFNQTRVAAPAITEPYIYQGKMIVEQVYPVVLDGAFAGIAGVDRALTDLEQMLARLARRLGANAYLISGRGSFIAAVTDDDEGVAMKTLRVADTAYASLFGTFRDRPDPIFIEAAVDPITDAWHYFGVARIPTGNWTLILSRSESEVLAPIRAALWRKIALALVGLGIITTVLIGSAVIVARRIRGAVDAAQRVAAGDLTGHTTATGRDETGRLLASLAEMTENLNDLVGQVKRSSIQLNSTATQVAATSREQEATTRSFGAATGQVAAAAKQISATSHDLSQTIQRVDTVATGTADLATTGRTGLDTMQATIQELDTATGAIADKLAVINEKASRITGVVTTITKVADQTNLLSVNAAIEAEKAGQFGQGFLVVAREIRRLADQTGGATLDIEQMVQQMQSAVSTGVMEMDRFADQVRRIVSDVAGIHAQMGDIIENVNSNTASFKVVNDGMQSQAAGAQQISEAMGQLSADAQQTSESVKEYAQVAEQLRTAVAALRRAIASFKLESE